MGKVLVWSQYYKTTLGVEQVKKLVLKSLMECYCNLGCDNHNRNLNKRKNRIFDFFSYTRDKMYFIT
jgi:hypothetical protein